MVPLIDLLAPKSQPKGKTANVTFDVVIPSLPGFVFSSNPPTKGWEGKDTARVFNKLMTQALGYEHYAVHGTDWGSDVGYSLYEQFNTTVRATHLTFLPFFPPSLADIATRNITLSPGEEFSARRGVDWETGGNGYFSEQTTKVWDYYLPHFLSVFSADAEQPNDIGLALYDNPVGQLAWIGEKFIICECACLEWSLGYV